MILDMAEINVIHELDIVRKLAELTPIPSERSIFRVHDRLRNENKNAYEPQVVAIGPYHHGKDNLQPMEEHKLRYLQQLHNRRNEGTVEGYIEAMREFEQKARKFYAEPISLDSNAFVEMMLLDGCFIIEFLFKSMKLDLRGPTDPIFQIEPNDPIFQIDHIRFGIFHDLVLFENQLPLSIVEELFNMTNNSTYSLDDLLRTFVSFFYWITPDERFLGTMADIKHLLGQLHYCCCYQFHSKVSQTVELEDIPRKSATELHEASCIIVDIKRLLGQLHYCCCYQFRSKVSQTVELEDSPRKSATELHEAGIKFKEIERGVDRPQIIGCSAVPEKNKKKIEERNLFDIRFVNGTLEIPTFVVHDGTESVLRNLMAYEQYLPYDTWHHFTAYHNFMDYLVSTSKDVEILTHRGVIRNLLGDNEVVATMLNKLGNNTIVSDIGYEEVYNKLNEHCRKKWNVWLAIFRRDYFNNPWALVSFLAAAGLLLLTLLQTTFTIHPAGKSN